MVDRLSALPVDVQSLILSKLPIREAVRCSVLSKQWRFRYTEMPELAPSPELLTAKPLWIYKLDALFVTTLENRISDILRLHSKDLEAFSLSTAIYPASFPAEDPLKEYFTRQSIYRWMRCVAKKNVKRLSLKYSVESEPPPPALFTCHRLTILKLHNCNLTTIPTDFAGFIQLTKCSFKKIQMTDDSLALFILQCPLLQKFSLKECRSGPEKPDISALNVTDLTVRYAYNLSQPTPRVQVLTVNCPKLQTLKILNVTDLTVNGMAFQQLSPAITGLEMELGSNLVELSLMSCYKFYSQNLSANRFLGFLGNLRSLRVLHIYNLSVNAQGRKLVVPLFNLLSKLPNLQRFHLLGDLSLEAHEGDAMPPYLANPLANLQFVDIQLFKYDETELRLLWCLLEIAPALKDVKLQPSRHPPKIGEDQEHVWWKDKNRGYKLFLEKWEALKKDRAQGNYTGNLCEFSFYF